jgi:hypothetical protein
MYTLSEWRVQHEFVVILPSGEEVVERDLVQQRLRGEIVEDASGHEEALVLGLVFQEKRAIVPQFWKHAVDAHRCVSASVDDKAHKSACLRDGLATKGFGCE